MEQTGWEMRPADWILLALLAVVLVSVVRQLVRVHCSSQSPSERCVLREGMLW
jgi:hypothetical protein